MCISTFFYHSNIQCVPIIKSHAKYSLYVRSRLCACAHARKCVYVCMHAWRKRETYTHYDWNARNALVFESTGSHTHAAPAVLPAVTSGAACPTAEGHFRLNRTALAGEGGGWRPRARSQGHFVGTGWCFSLLHRIYSRICLRVGNLGRVFTAGVCLCMWIEESYLSVRSYW